MSPSSRPASGLVPSSAALLWLAASAHAGSLDAELALDTLAATSSNPGPAAGSPESFTAAELGMRVRADLLELDDRLAGAVDYRGREPLGGAFPNTTHRLLYEGTVGYALVEDRLEAAIGRFMAPSAVLLPVDGVRMAAGLGDHTGFSLFAGRRGFSTSRRNLGFDVMLPAAGASIDHTGARLQGTALVAYAGDQAVVAGGSDGEVVEDYNALNALVRGSWLPTKVWALGGQASVVQQASYLLGPTWTDARLEVRALDLYQGLLWASARPRDWLRLDADAHHQQVAVVRGGTLEGDVTSAEVQDPNHTDLRLRAGVRPADLGWARAESRLRLRPDRSEVRLGGTLDPEELGVPGLYASGRLFADLISGGADDIGGVDRLTWSAALGWTREAFDVQAGASAVERAAVPVSGRVGAPGAPDATTDLAPFVLEAQEVAFVRGFYTARSWFVGLDGEVGLGDSELRAMVQVGLLSDTSW